MQLQIKKSLIVFFVTDFDLYKAIMSFPNGSAAGPDKIVPQIFKDLVSKSNGSVGPNFLKSLTKLINLNGDGKIPEPLRPFFFGTKQIALIKIDGGLRPIAIGNTLRRSASKSARSKALSERQNFFGNVQVGCGTKRGAEIAAHSFRNLIERDDNPKCTVFLKLDFKNAFNSLAKKYPSGLAKLGPLRIGKIGTPPVWQNWDPSGLTKLGPLRIGKIGTPPDWQNWDSSGLAKLGPLRIGNIGTLPDWQNWDPSGLAKLGLFRIGL